MLVSAVALRWQQKLGEISVVHIVLDFGITQKVGEKMALQTKSSRKHGHTRRLGQINELRTVRPR